MHDNALIYDLEAGWYRADIRYWERLVAEYRPHRVLDLACGAGRMTIPVASTGVSLVPDFRVVGLDISQPLLARARARLVDLDPNTAGVIDFVAGDMVDFDLGATFDLILLGFNSLAYVYGLDDQLSCLRAVRRHLAPGGRFAIDLIVPQLAFLVDAERTAPLRLEIDRASPEHGIKRFLRYATERYNPLTQTDDTLYHYEIAYADGRHERITDDLAWQMYFPRELELLMRLASLHVAHKYGTYDGTPFDRGSMQYLWIMESA